MTSVSDGLAIEAHDLVKHFGPVQAVNGISLEVRKGEIFGFLGPNGAGKSTTINILCTLLRPTGGRASVAGHDVDREPAAVRSRIGLVFQDPSLDAQLTARENLQFHAFIYSVPAAERAERIKQALEMVELTDRADSIVMTFSGGMKRRLEIARGMLHTPEVLFLDEPTIGLDPQTRRHIWAYLRKLRHEAGVTLFMTTHYMDEAEECDRIAIVDGGKIVALGTPAELKAMVGGDVVTIATADNRVAAEEMKATFGLEPAVANGSLRVEVKDAAAFIPQLLRELSQPVTSVASHQPSLDDVFLKLTGHAIRAEEAGATDMMRMFGRAFRGGRR
ncbi:MAG TPA: ATP-binding cassette domain-containing protein [Candidatus Limnocylindria bacterium]|nr:ATP-binding cassette domain-containing protein [Candidatus Limnocylindria bacterium]